MAASRSGFPTPPSDPGDPDHWACPVCGWRPCTRECRLGLSLADLKRMEAIRAGKDDAYDPFEPQEGEG